MANVFWCDFSVTFRAVLLRSLAFVMALTGSTHAAAPVTPPADLPVLAPSEIVAAAPASEWVAIAPADLLVMDLASDARGGARRVVIQLMPPPISQGWIGNIRKLAAARWWDGTSVNRVQDNYVVQWGDPNAEDKAKAKSLPPGLVTVPQADYEIQDTTVRADAFASGTVAMASAIQSIEKRLREQMPDQAAKAKDPKIGPLKRADAYDAVTAIWQGWPLGMREGAGWPIHCYAMVGVGRDMPPDTGTGAELYTVIGHAPRHLDRNIALVGRVIEGIEHLSSLPRGTGALGFYEKPEQRVAITSIRLMTDFPETDRLRFEYIATDGMTFARYAAARANRRDPFFIQPAGGADICNIPVPVRRVAR